MFWQGIQYGLVLTLLVGPIFFALLQTGLEQGFRAGLGVALGVWLSDVAYITLAYFSLSLIRSFANNPSFTFYVGLVGGTILIVFGILSALTRPRMSMRPRKHPIRSDSYFGLITKGILLNGFNPFTVIFWIALVSTVFLNVDYSGKQAVSFFAGLMTMVMIADVLKILLAKRIRRWLSPRHLLWIRRITGILLFAFGLVLIGRVLLML